ncbi:translin [Amylostereum chailletii]|nr:translin [Amylostereum chailletii]
MDPQHLEHISHILDTDAELREKIKEQVSDFDKKTRSMAGTLNKIHSTPTTEIPNLVQSVRAVLITCQSTTFALQDLIPPSCFWKYKDMWTNSLRSAVYSATFSEFLSTGKLLPLAWVSEQLGINDEWKDRFTLCVEDYLHGVITMVNELSRLAVNAVTLGDFEAPIRISVFVKELFAGFTMLNLKNDLLRRRFDSLKYDIKKIEEVVYDVSLRKLVSPTGKATTNAA